MSWTGHQARSELASSCKKPLDVPQIFDIGNRLFAALARIEKAGRDRRKLLNALDIIGWVFSYIVSSRTRLVDRPRMTNMVASEVVRALRRPHMIRDSSKG